MSKKRRNKRRRGRLRGVQLALPFPEAADPQLALFAKGPESEKGASEKKAA
jgi:hypothetical protein